MVVVISPDGSSRIARVASLRDPPRATEPASEYYAFEAEDARDHQHVQTNAYATTLGARIPRAVAAAEPGLTMCGDVIVARKDRADMRFAEATAIMSCVRHLRDEFGEMERRCVDGAEDDGFGFSLALCEMEHQLKMAAATAV
jgi:hypothetical protein